MSIGYPDYQTYPTWTGTPVNVVNASVSNTTPYKQDFQLGNFSALLIETAGQAFGLGVTVTYYTDSTKTAQGASLSWTLQAVTSLNVIIPNLGAYAEITLSMTQTGSQTVGLFVTPLNMPITKPVYFKPGNGIFSSNTVAASGTQRYNLTQTTEGTIYLFFVPGDATGKLNVDVQQVDQSGANIYPAIKAVGPAAGVYLTGVAVNAPYTVVVTNTDAAGAHAFNMRCAVLS